MTIPEGLQALLVRRLRDVDLPLVEAGSGLLLDLGESRLPTALALRQGGHRPLRRPVVVRHLLVE